MAELPCPRCGGKRQGEFYSVCAACARDLRSNAEIQKAWRNLLDGWWPGYMAKEDE